MLVNSVREFIGGDAELGPEVRLVGATFDHPRAETPFPWDRLDGGRRVYASLGTNVELLGRGFFRTLADALGGLDAQVIVSAPDGILADPPENFVVAPFVPQTALLPQVDAVVSHAGHNTVVEALVWAGRSSYSRWPSTAVQRLPCRGGRRRRSVAATAAHRGPARRCGRARPRRPGLRVGGTQARRRAGCRRRRLAGADALEALADARALPEPLPGSASLPLAAETCARKSAPSRSSGLTS